MTYMLMNTYWRNLSFLISFCIPESCVELSLIIHVAKEDFALLILSIFIFFESQFIII